MEGANRVRRDESAAAAPGERRAPPKRVRAGPKYACDDGKSGAKVPLADHRVEDARAPGRAGPQESIRRRGLAWERQLPSDRSPGIRYSETDAHRCFGLERHGEIPCGFPTLAVKDPECRLQIGYRWPPLGAVMSGMQRNEERRGRPIKRLRCDTGNGHDIEMLHDVLPDDACRYAALRKAVVQVDDEVVALPQPCGRVSGPCAPTALPTTASVCLTTDSGSKRRNSTAASICSARCTAAGSTSRSTSEYPRDRESR